MIAYTATFGEYDILREPKNDSVNILFTNNEIIPKEWIPKVAHLDFESRKKSRYIKINSHLFFQELTLWHGGNIESFVTERQALKWLGSADIAVFHHPHRKNVSQEAKICIDWKLDERDVIENQIARYSQDGYRDNGLSACWVITRRYNDKVIRFNELWWDEVNNGSIRDQLSFDYCVWKSGVKIAYIPDKLHGNKWFKYHKHGS